MLRLACGYAGVKEGCYHGQFDSLLVKAGSGVLDIGESTSKGVPAHLDKTLAADTAFGQL